MAKKDLSHDEIAERIVDAILAEPILSKNNLFHLTKYILKIWVNQRNEYRKTGNHKTDRLLETIKNKE